jgi:hypothetical protein
MLQSQTPEESSSQSYMNSANATPRPATVTNPPPCDNKAAAFIVAFAGDGDVELPPEPVADALPEDADAFPPLVELLFPPALLVEVGAAAPDFVLFLLDPSAFPVSDDASAVAVFSPFPPFPPLEAVVEIDY